MITRTRRYTAKHAQYQPETLVLVGNNPNDVARHYVMTRHGAVARAFLPGPLMVNVALWRPRNQHPQFQGTITRLPDGRYQAVDPDNRPVSVADNYLDVEAALLPLRTRTRSYGSGTWPYEIRRELLWSRRQVGPTCRDCGHPLALGGCTRPDLHWPIDAAA